MPAKYTLTKNNTLPSTPTSNVINQNINTQQPTQNEIYNNTITIRQRRISDCTIKTKNHNNINNICHNCDHTKKLKIIHHTAEDGQNLHQPPSSIRSRSFQYACKQHHWIPTPPNTNNSQFKPSNQLTNIRSTSFAIPPLFTTFLSRLINCFYTLDQKSPATTTTSSTHLHGGEKHTTEDEVTYPHDSFTSGKKNIKLKIDNAITISVKDYQTLHDGMYLNDTIIDVYFKWLFYSNTTIQKHIYHFSYQFYSTLVRHGPHHVIPWTRRTQTNIFQKKILLFPINEKFHWSLGMVLYPANISHPTLQPYICILDSADIHAKDPSANNIRQWLTLEWNRYNNQHREFTPNNCPLKHFPTPKQHNGYDCGIFTCKYASILHQIFSTGIFYKGTI